MLKTFNCHTGQFTLSKNFIYKDTTFLHLPTHTYVYYKRVYVCFVHVWIYKQSIYIRRSIYVYM